MNKTNRNIVFATSNQNKINEVSTRISYNNIKIISLVELGVTEDIPETSDTIHGNAVQKSTYIFDRYKTDVFSEDTGLEVFSLNGEPGIYSARYAGPQRNDMDNMNLLLDKLKNKEDRSAQFRTVISLVLNGRFHEFEGICKGKIAYELSGEKGFGYDPIFIPDGYDKSFAHFTKDEKNDISHRGKAVEKLLSFLNSMPK